ncbi:MAG: exopolyphosphatase [Dermatophilaceae bacterium]|nr:exopolyphosphatase [Actinomycetales bacterium]MBP8880138.1 exopolyphosphatase [Dermatophilaceae bacterium]MBP9917596.1 exopolyphosphatase [Dermatophilaceae bacterium]
MTDRQPSTVRVAAIDCGTNSLRLLIADVNTATGVITDQVRRMEIVRLGHGVDRTGIIDPAAIARTLGVCVDYAQQCREYAVERIRFVATSATRDARNASDFVEGVRQTFGDLDVTPEVIPGSEEAFLSFLGATGDLVAEGVPGPYLVVDIGGGSTELVRGTSTVEASKSIDIGCVRMTERHLQSDPPTSAQRAAAIADIDAEIDAGADVVDFSAVRTLVGLAGSVTTVTAQVLGLSAYDPEAIHLSTSTPARVQQACEELLAMPRTERAALGYMHPGRVDVIGAGALVWSRVIDRVCRDTGLGADLPVITSEHDILDGIARSLATR